MAVRNVSQTALRAFLAQETEEVVLMCLTFTHTSFVTPYRLVTNTEPLMRALGEYTPFAFQLNLPPETDDQVPQLQLTIDNVDNSILKAIRVLPVGQRVQVTMEVVLASAPDDPEVGPIDFKILSIDFDESQITGTIGLDDDFLNTTFPSGEYTPVNSPGVFA